MYYFVRDYWRVREEMVEFYKCDLRVVEIIKEKGRCLFIVVFNF